MKKGSGIFFIIFYLILSVSLPACSGAAANPTSPTTSESTAAATSTSNTPVTTPAASTTQPPASTPGSTVTAPAGTTAPTTIPVVTTAQAETTTGDSPRALDMTALALDAATHPQAYSALCLLCHGPGMGAQQYPLPPVWDGTPLTPGPYTITPGSDQDHTGRTDTTTCVTQEGCHTVAWAGPPQTTAAPAPASTTSAAAATFSGKVQISMSNTGFSPSVITVTAGTMVIWSNGGHDERGIESDNPGDFGKLMLPGETYSVYFFDKGTFGYHLSGYPEIKGTIIVV